MRRWNNKKEIERSHSALSSLAGDTVSSFGKAKEEMGSHPFLVVYILTINAR